MIHSLTGLMLHCLVLFPFSEQDGMDDGKEFDDMFESMKVVGAFVCRNVEM